MALAQLTAQILKDHPGVPQVTLEALKDSGGGVIFVDVREPREYAVSRIPGAVRIDDPDELHTFVQAQDKPVILYCSVGRRSADLTEQMHRRGATNVSNFAGSIFAWGNAGMPLEDDLGPTDRVHPFNWYWGWRYLDEPLHAMKPRASARQ